MSASPPKADMLKAYINVRIVPVADIARRWLLAEILNLSFKAHPTAREANPRAGAVASNRVEGRR